MAAENDIAADEYITYSAKKCSDGLYLHIEYINSMFNCASDSVFIQSALNEDKTLKVYEVENSQDANCLCPHDISADIGPLDEGATCSINLYKKIITDSSDGNLCSSFTLNFTADVQGRILQ